MYLFFAQVARHEIRSQEIREEAREDDPESHDSADEDGPTAKVHVQVRPGSGRGVVLGWNEKKCPTQRRYIRLWSLVLLLLLKRKEKTFAQARRH